MGGPVTGWDWPVLPYGSADDDDPEGRSSGWSGSDTSRERARRDDDDGTTSKRQRAVMAHLIRAGSHGVTWEELARAHGWHHGQASGALSGLHKAGRIARLTTEHARGRCAVYVAPEHVNGRAMSPYGVTRSLANISDAELIAEITRREVEAGWEWPEDDETGRRE